MALINIFSTPDGDDNEFFRSLYSKSIIEEELIRAVEALEKSSMFPVLIPESGLVTTISNNNTGHLTLNDLEKIVAMLPDGEPDTFILHPDKKRELPAALLHSEITLIENEFLTETVQTRLPRSKKKRIRKKWSKRYSVQVPSNKVIAFNSGDSSWSRVNH